jgi:triphosphoribosyl-dephospho-CoA synthase
MAATIAAAAAASLLDELETWPKPGLVSHVDAGSHTDMDAGTFRRSVAAIEPFYAALVTAGASRAEMAHTQHSCHQMQSSGQVSRATGSLRPTSPH